MPAPFPAVFGGKSSVTSLSSPRTPPLSYSAPSLALPLDEPEKACGRGWRDVNSPSLSRKGTLIVVLYFTNYAAFQPLTWFKCSGILLARCITRTDDFRYFSFEEGLQRAKRFKDELETQVDHNSLFTRAPKVNQISNVLVLLLLYFPICCRFPKLKRQSL